MSAMKQLPMFDTVEIPLTQGYAALVDSCDADLIQYDWAYLKKGPYVIRRERIENKLVMVLLHRTILSRMLGAQLGRWDLVDHINGDGLDNRRSNLRLSSQSTNMANRGKQRDNTSGYKGVTRSHNKWMAQIKVNGQRIYLGSFNTPEAAAAAYNVAAPKYFGEFARLNEIPD